MASHSAFLNKAVTIDGMFDTYLDIAQSRGLAFFYGVTLGGGTLMILLMSWLWWHYSYLNPQTVFWSAVNNNLVVNGVTKHTASQDNTGKLEQYDQISLGAPNLVKSVATLTQTGANEQKNAVVTETLGTPSVNFSRYTKIETSAKTSNGKAPDFSKVVNQWSKQELGTSANGSFAEAIFDIIPFARLSAAQRHEVLNGMQRDNTYGIDFGAVQKARKDGRLFYGYDASIAPDKYVSLLKQVDSMMGLNQLKNLDPSQYQGSRPVQVKIIVDAAAHQLAALEYTGTQREVTYTAWGASRDGILPTNTISQADLQRRLNTVVNGQQ